MSRDAGKQRSLARPAGAGARRRRARPQVIGSEPLIDQGTPAAVAGVTAGKSRTTHLQLHRGPVKLPIKAQVDHKTLRELYS